MELNVIFSLLEATPSPAPAVGPKFTPNNIEIPPRKPFDFMCQASEGSEPKIIFAGTGKPVDKDPRFTVTYVSENVIQVSALRGLPSAGETITLE